MTASPLSPLRTVTISLDQVSPPTMPSTGDRPLALWKLLTLPSVPGPKAPSAPVAKPRADSRYWTVVTLSPWSPLRTRGQPAAWAAGATSTAARSAANIAATTAGMRFMTVPH
ncbi:hypothetical protein BG452_23260 [Streptomyces sp. CBMA123]|nr:hypothetical protein [Streptomyces sp. CBMA123]